MSKPTIVLVPGAWHKPTVYSQVVAHLRKHDYSTISLPLPSAGAVPPHKDFSTDVAVIRDCLSELASGGKEIVLLVHSYAGLPGGEAPKGLGKKERQAKGLKGGVIRYVVMNGFATPAGFQPTTEATYDQQLPEWMKLDFEKNIVTVLPEDAKKVFYHDVSPAKADDLAAQLVHQSLGVYFSTSTHAAWTEIPSTYLVGDLDRTWFTPSMTEMMLQGARMVEPTAFDVVEHCEEGGHCLMVSHAGWTANALRRAAGEKF